MNDTKEIRVVYYGQLIIPNPQEHYKNTRSYEQMRFEYELRNAGKITEEDALDLAIKLNKTEAYMKQPLILTIALFFVIFVAAFVLIALAEMITRSWY